MRRILFVVALLAALVPTAGQSASAQVAPLAPFSGYSTGTALHAGALETSGTTRLVDTEVAFSGANVNSSGLGAALMNEMKQAYQLVTTAADNNMSGGRGSGLEVGVATVVPNGTNANQINPGSTIQAFAPESTGLLEKHFIDVDLEPIINSDYLRGEAQAMYGPCVLGQPISFGRGYAGSADLVTSSTEAMLATNTTPGNDAVSQSRSFTYLVPNGSGKYALVSETRQILAPITLLPGIAAIGDLPAIGEVVIEFAGEWVLRSTATGLAGGSTVVYGPDPATSPEVKVLTIKVGGLVEESFNTEQFLGNKGLGIDIPGVGKIAIGEAPRAINGAFGSSPVRESNGTRAAAAVDVLRVTTSELAATLGIDLADIRVGHMESEAIVPPGGIECGIPVKKTGTPANVMAGEVVNYTITVPSDKDAMNAVACDIMNIKVVDVTTAEPGVLFKIESASNGGKIDGNTVTWENIGTYKPGDAPKVLNVGLRVLPGSAAGIITDTATATAILGNCRGNASANAGSLSGLASLNSAALSGSGVAFSGTTTVAAAALVAPAGQGPTPIGGVQTGAGGTSPISNRMLPIGTALGSLALVASLNARRRRRNG